MLICFLSAARIAPRREASTSGTEISLRLPVRQEPRTPRKLDRSIHRTTQRSGRQGSRTTEAGLTTARCSALRAPTRSANRERRLARLPALLIRVNLPRSDQAGALYAVPPVRSLGERLDHVVSVRSARPPGWQTPDDRGAESRVVRVLASRSGLQARLRHARQSISIESERFTRFTQSRTGTVPTSTQS